MEKRMHFGQFNLMGYRTPGTQAQQIYDDAIEQVKAAEANGFEIAWFAEHHFSNYCVCPSPLVMLARLAGETSRIRLGSAVVVTPLYQPVRLISEIGMVDALTHGRLVLGVGSGYQPYEFERFGLDLATGRARWDESIDIIMKALGGQPFSYDGKFFKIPETMVFPQAVQQPRPPVWITAQSPESLEGAVRRGFNVLTGGFGISIDRLAEFRRLYDRVVADVKPSEPLQVGAQRAVYVADSQAEARAAADEARWNMRVTLSLRNHYEQVERGRAIPVPAASEPDLDDLLDRFLVIGTPDVCIRQIRRLQDQVGITHFNCSFWFADVDQPRVLRSMARFAREVIPAFR
jgi:alkanesulfonate monooxygenase SsuD/methylene tetrahydromethanopterin reductase-like flavin-dependent oxidoreductase (luciferase family)